MWIELKDALGQTVMVDTEKIAVVMIPNRFAKEYSGNGVVQVGQAMLTMPESQCIKVMDILKGKTPLGVEQNDKVIETDGNRVS